MKKKIKKNLKKFLDHDNIGMNKAQYLRMIEQTGEEIDWDRITPDSEDFPDSVITAVNIYRSLGDRVYPDIGFIGKDYTNLPLLYKLYYINEEIEQDWIFELLLEIDGITIAASQKRLASEYDKIKRKNG